MTDALLAVTATGTTYLALVTLLVTVLRNTAANDYISLVLGLVEFTVPVVNYVRIFIAIRRNNNRMHDAVSEQGLSTLYRREKKVAENMFIVIVVLLVCVTPGMFVTIIKSYVIDYSEVLIAWSTGLTYLNSSINPILYLVRNRAIRNGVKSLLCR